MSVITTFLGRVASGLFNQVQAAPARVGEGLKTVTQVAQAKGAKTAQWVTDRTVRPLLRNGVATVATAFKDAEKENRFLDKFDTRLRRALISLPVELSALDSALPPSSC